MSDEERQMLVNMLGTGLRPFSGQQGLAPAGLRQSGDAPKGLGYFGAVPNISGDMSTELSVDSDINGKNVEYPLMVPTLSADDMQSVLSGNPSQEAYQKALSHALYRQQQGQSPFAGPTDLRRPLP